MLNLNGKNWRKKGLSADTFSYRRSSISRRGSITSFFSTLGLPVVPDRRTIFVLVSLLSAVTVLGGLLLILEPEGFVGTSGEQFRGANVIERVGVVGEDDKESDLFEITGHIDPKQWEAIVIHDSGQLRGNAEEIDASHKLLGFGGLGYHFVITNGEGGKNGELERGYRWDMQFSGKHTFGRLASWYNEHAIGICLVGNGDRQRPTQAQIDRLTTVVRQLQDRFGIPRQNVIVNYGDQSGRHGSPLFPMAAFSQQIR